MREAFDLTREAESEIQVNLSFLKEKPPVTKEISSLSKVGINVDNSKASETIEGLQSKIRELEKKAQLQNVLHEELALEMAAIKCRARPAMATPPPALSLPADTTWNTDLHSFSTDSIISIPRSCNAGVSCGPEPSTRHSLQKMSTSQGNCYSTTAALTCLPIPSTLPQSSMTINMPQASNLKSAEAQFQNIILGNSLDGSNLKPLADISHNHHLHHHHHHQPRLMPQIPTGLSSHFDLDRSVSRLHRDLVGVKAQDSEVDMLDVPGKGRCYVYIAKYSYDPFAHSPNDCPEAELSINAGDYLLVWGGIDEDGFFDGELLDGRRGLVPSNFIQKLVGDDLLEFHQSVVQGLRDCDDTGSTNIPNDFNYHSLQPGDAGQFSVGEEHLVQMVDDEEDDLQPGEPPDVFFSVLVPAPKQLTLERQLNKSVLIGWNHPESSSPPVDCYHVYVDGVLKVTVKASDRPRALVEGVDSTRPHRISVRCVTANRRTSRDAACTMVIGKEVQLGPTTVRASRVTATSAVISWMPSNSNYQHTVCVNNVELRTVKPGIYRHTITGLAPNTVYRVTIKAKNIRAPHFDEKITVRPERYSCHIDFCTLPKGLPEPPTDVQIEAGPQDGTVLVTWHPVHNNINCEAVVTGYAVYADGKKVTDVDTPTGDHALIDISKLLTMNPKHITVRTKAHDSQSSDSTPSQIPSNILKGRHRSDKSDLDKTTRHGYSKSQQRVGQVVIETEENLSDKEIYPNNHISIPAIEITKDGGNEMKVSEEEAEQRRGGSEKVARGRLHHRPAHQHASFHREQMYLEGRGGRGAEWPGPGARANKGSGSSLPHHSLSKEKHIRWFVALFDYDPTTMSPNPDACEEELPFMEGDSIKVYGDKDPDGFYWGECKGRRGFVPHNMVVEVHAPEAGCNMHDTRRERDRWGDIYANMTPVKRMIALYDYDPEELSPNADAEVELSFRTGNIINVYGEMDDDGFYMGELNGVRGLVPSNFLTGAPACKYEGEPVVGPVGSPKGGKGGRPEGKGQGPGTRGPPLPPRQEPPHLHKDACPVFKPVDQRKDGKVVEKETVAGTTGVAPGAAAAAAVGAGQATGQGSSSTGWSSYGGIARKYEAPVNPMMGVGGTGEPDERSQPPRPPLESASHNFIQRLTEITTKDTSVDNILSKGKELIFMKFGLGK